MFHSYLPLDRRTRQYHYAVAKQRFVTRGDGTEFDGHSVRPPWLHVQICHLGFIVLTNVFIVPKHAPQIYQDKIVKMDSFNQNYPPTVYQGRVSDHLKQMNLLPRGDISSTAKWVSGV